MARFNDTPAWWLGRDYQERYEAFAFKVADAFPDVPPPLSRTVMDGPDEFNLEHFEHIDRKVDPYVPTWLAAFMDAEQFAYYLPRLMHFTLDPDYDAEPGPILIIIEWHAAGKDDRLSGLTDAQKATIKEYLELLAIQGVKEATALLEEAWRRFLA